MLQPCAALRNCTPLWLWVYQGCGLLSLWARGEEQVNERIKELVNQSYIKDEYGVPLFDHQKFAELIVGECLDELAMGRFDNPSAAWMEERNDGIDFCITVIKEHFGVEE